MTYEQWKKNCCKDGMSADEVEASLEQAGLYGDISKIIPQGAFVVTELDNSGNATWKAVYIDGRHVLSVTPIKSV